MSEIYSPVDNYMKHSDNHSDLKPKTSQSKLLGNLIPLAVGQHSDPYNKHLKKSTWLQW